MGCFKKQISPSNTVHDEHVIDGLVKCKVKWTGYEEQTWEPSMLEKFI